MQWSQESCKVTLVCVCCLISMSSLKTLADTVPSQWNQMFVGCVLGKTKTKTHFVQRHFLSCLVFAQCCHVAALYIITINRIIYNAIYSELVQLLHCSPNFLLNPLAIDCVHQSVCSVACVVGQMMMSSGVSKKKQVLSK